MVSPTTCRSRCVLLLLLAVVDTAPVAAQLLTYEGFGEYGAGVQLGSGLNGGLGWGGAYNVRSAIKPRVLIESRTTNQVNYTNGEVTILGGNRALRFSDNANGSYAVQRPLGTTFAAASGEVLWFSVLFRTATGGASPLANEDLFQLGFDDNANAESGIPRVSIGASNASDTFPVASQFFARGTTANQNTVFFSSLPIAAVTTYLLVACIQPTAGVYDKVRLYVNPNTLEDPGPPSASITLSSGLTTLSHAFIRTASLDANDVYVLDEWRIGRDYGSVVQSLRNALQILAPSPPGGSTTLRWPASLTGVVLEASATLAPESWIEVPGPFTLSGAESQYTVPVGPENPRGFFRLRR